MRKTLAATAGALLAAAAVLAGAGPAAAAPTRIDLVVQQGGVWKGYASVNGETGRLCVRAYHSVPGARAVANVWGTSGQLWGRVSDQGGDTQPTCTYIRRDPGYWHTLELQFHGASGEYLQTVGNFSYPY